MRALDQALATHNRLNHRAILLTDRALHVIDQPGQFARALRIHDRAKRALQRADEALLPFTRLLSESLR